MTNERKRVLGIVGSPRCQGNTEILVDEILSGAEENGALTHKVILSELDIAPCKACEVCTKTGSCVHQDDMPDLLSQMFENDVWILGTPVFWEDPTAQFKTFLDRWYGVNDRKLFEGRDVILVIPSGGASEKAYGPTLKILTRVVRYLKMNHITTILALGVGRKGAIRNHPELLFSARKAGMDVALVDSSG